MRAARSPLADRLPQLPRRPSSSRRPTGSPSSSGGNGEGKTNLLEAVGYLATLRSFRGAPAEALVRTGAERAVVRAEADREGRRLLIEAELQPAGRDRVQVNRQPLRRARDLLGALRVTVFAPDDLALVKGGPQGRRRVPRRPARRPASPPRRAARARSTGSSRQRNALLKQAGGRGSTAGGRAPPSTCGTPSWPTAGEALAGARAALVADLEPDGGARPTTGVAERSAARSTARPTSRSWAGGLAAALAAARTDDLRRGVTHRRAPPRRPGR